MCCEVHKKTKNNLFHIEYGVHGMALIREKSLLKNV